MMHEWRSVFWITFVILTISAIVYSLWGSGELQPWNNPDNMTVLKTKNNSTKADIPLECCTTSSVPSTKVIYSERL